MKKILFTLLSAAAFTTATAQTTGITPEHYNFLKMSGQLVPGAVYQLQGNEDFIPYRYQPGNQVKSQTKSACNCLLSLDTTYMVAMAPNDDGSSALLALPFTFEFYGVNYNSVYINNNGNISFVSPYYEFTANPFPDPTFNMIAPFWGDVDTRNPGSGLVYYKMDAHSMIVKWENVGYFNAYADKLNTFQLIITDGTDPIIPGGNNVSFCYGDMQWTTGDASSGVGGFGGVPATVGVNIGNGINYFQVGRFDQPGGAFDGPYSLNDGIDFLDNQEIYFNVSDTLNIPPIIVNETICDTIDVYSGDTLRAAGDPLIFPISVTTPEIDQIVNASFACPAAPASFTYSVLTNTDVFKKYECTFDYTGLPNGIYVVNITASDNGTPALTATSKVVIRVNGSTVGINEIASENMFSIYPNPANEYITIKGKNSLASIQLLDVLGHVIMQENAQNMQHTLNISALNNGVYFIRATTENGSAQTTRFLKK